MFIHSTRSNIHNTLTHTFTDAGVSLLNKSWSTCHTKTSPHAVLSGVFPARPMWLHCMPCFSGHMIVTVQWHHHFWEKTNYWGDPKCRYRVDERLKLWKFYRFNLKTVLCGRDLKCTGFHTENINSCRLSYIKNIIHKTSPSSKYKQQRSRTRNVNLCKRIHMLTFRPPKRMFLSSHQSLQLTCWRNRLYSSRQNDIYNKKQTKKNYNDIKTHPADGMNDFVKTRQSKSIELKSKEGAAGEN